MTDEEKVTNGRNSRGSYQLGNDLAASHVDVPEINESVIKTAEEKLQEVAGNLLHSPEIEPSIYQTDIVTQSTKPTTTKPTPKGGKTKATPTTASTTLAPAKSVSTKATPTSASTKPPAEGSTKATPTTKPTKPGKGASPTPTQKGATGSPSPSPTGTGPTAEPEEGAEPTGTATTGEPDESATTAQPGDIDGSTTPEGTPTGSPTPTGDAVTKEGDVKSEEGEKPESETGGSTTTETTTEPPPRDPYQIDIPIEKKINKRTKRKLWEEIEKRKPLIPKYVERHITKYAKPPFELWGCKNRGKSSCYGCG